MLGCWWQIPIRAPSPLNPACLSVATDRLDELWCPVLFCNPLEPVCLQPPPLYTHAQANKDTSSLVRWAQKQHLFSFSVSLSRTLTGTWDWQNTQREGGALWQRRTSDISWTSQQGLDNIDLAWILWQQTNHQLEFWEFVAVVFYRIVKSSKKKTSWNSLFLVSSSTCEDLHCENSPGLQCRMQWLSIAASIMISLKYHFVLFHGLCRVISHCQVIHQKYCDIRHISLWRKENMKASWNGWMWGGGTWLSVPNDRRWYLVVVEQSSLETSQAHFNVEPWEKKAQDCQAVLNKKKKPMKAFIGK